VWNGPFKSKLRDLYYEWMIHGEKPTTSTGNLKEPPMDVYLEWVQTAWESLSKDMIAKSFLACGVTNALDGSEDDLIHVFKVV
jgi:hypothetical protein